MLALIAALRPILAQIKTLETEIAKALSEHPDG